MTNDAITEAKKMAKIAEKFPYSGVSENNDGWKGRDPLFELDVYSSRLELYTPDCHR